MEGFADYGTDDDSISSHQENMKLNSEIQTSDPNVLPKKKQLDISFLPKEIQDALISGVSNFESDDDEEDVDNNLGKFKKFVPRNSSDISPSMNNRPAQTITNNKLLAMLPKPCTNSSESSVSSILKKLPVVKDMEFGNENEDKELSDTHPINDKLEENETFSNDEIHVSIQAIKKPLFNLSNEPVSRKFIAPINSVLQIKPSLYNIESCPAIGPQFEIPQQQQYDDIASLNDSQSYTNSNMNNISAKRKRDRDLEHQLLNGNIDSINGSFADVVSTATEWNSRDYNEQIQREMEVREKYNLTSTSGVPSKNQNRKHQINSLVVKAAEMELMLMEKKNERSRTKAQTQGKYGW